jgi:hypothetical protein
MACRGTGAGRDSNAYAGVIGRHAEAGQRMQTGRDKLMNSRRQMLTGEGRQAGRKGSGR